MTVTIKIPSPMRGVVNGARSFEVEATTIRELIDKIEAEHPGFQALLCDESGELFEFVNLYVDGDDARLRQGVATALRDGDEVMIVPAVSGGQWPLESR